MRGRSFGFVAPLLASAWLMPAPAHAQLLRCDSKKMVAADYAAMKSAALRAARGHVLDWSHATPCMNPGRGRVWIEGMPEPQTDGSVLDPRAECLRDTGRWKCTVDSRRRYEFTMQIAGKDQPFKLDIPLEFGVAEVRALVARGFEIAPKLSWREECGITPQYQHKLADAEREQWLRDAYTANGEFIAGSIEQSADQTSLIIGSMVLEFSPTPGRVAEKTFTCWGVEIIVT